MLIQYRAVLKTVSQRSNDYHRHGNKMHATEYGLQTDEKLYLWTIAEPKNSILIFIAIIVACSHSGSVQSASGAELQSA